MVFSKENLLFEMKSHLITLIVFAFSIIMLVALQVFLIEYVFVVGSVGILFCIVRFKQVFSDFNKLKASE